MSWKDSSLTYPFPHFCICPQENTDNTITLKISNKVKLVFHFSKNRINFFWNSDTKQTLTLHLEAFLKTVMWLWFKMSEWTLKCVRDFTFRHIGSPADSKTSQWLMVSHSESDTCVHPAGRDLGRHSVDVVDTSRVELWRQIRRVKPKGPWQHSSRFRFLQMRTVEKLEITCRRSDTNLSFSLWLKNI